MTRHNTSKLRNRAALAAAAALVAFAAIVALDFPQPAAAQSDEQRYGKINARRVADDRIEFGWQPTSVSGEAIGPRVFPRARFLPQDAPIDRWLRSSPVEVDGAAIGRINARMLSGGRIEFGFTPTDGERILPPARYFPHNATRGRWLSSTTIAISSPGPDDSDDTPATGFIAVSAGSQHTCAIRESGAIECWGSNDSGQIDAPTGSFNAVSAGSQHTCAIRESGAIECWGGNEYGQVAPRAGSFSAVSAGGDHTCAIRESGEIECWGSNNRRDWSNETQTYDEVYVGQSDAPAGSFTAVSAGIWHTCAIRESGAIIECWGDNQSRQAAPRAGSFSAVSAGGFHTCAIRESGEIRCWGNEWAGSLDAPAGSFTAVSAGAWHTCAIGNSGAIECWGSNTDGQTDAPAGSFSAVNAGGWAHTCAIRESGAIECWGSNEYGQTDAPAP